MDNPIYYKNFRVINASEVQSGECIYQIEECDPDSKNRRFEVHAMVVLDQRDGSLAFNVVRHHIDPKSESIFADSLPWSEYDA